MLRKDFYLLFCICFISFTLDLFWVYNHNIPPAWDQAYHLSTLHQFSSTLANIQFFSLDWWNNFLRISNTYRGPLTYILSSPLFVIFGSTFKAAILSNILFNVVLIFSSYYSARILYSRDAGIWAALFCSVSPALVTQRTDYLIDFSQASITTLTWLFFTIWFFRKKTLNVSFSLITGTLLGLMTLVRPTGLVFFILPILICFFKLFYSIYHFQKKIIINYIAVILSFILSIYPWFKMNWLTIISSLNQAVNWGLDYQDGLEVNTLSGWLFYPLLLPKLLGNSLFFTIIVGTFISLIFLRTSIQEQFKLVNYRFYIWYISFPLGALFVCILMTTKDYRFFLPILPQFCILLAIIFNLFQAKYNGYFFWKKFILFISIATLLWNQFSIGINLTDFPVNKPNSEQGWPIESIIHQIVNSSPNKKSVLAVLSDTKYLNAFNLDVEGKRQNSLVSARQILTKIDNIEDDLRNYDWFLTKSGDLGVMSDERHELLSEFLKKSSTFTITHSWRLPDDSIAYLFRRREETVFIKPVSCSNLTNSFSLSPIAGGLELSFSASYDDLSNSNILIDIISHNKVFTFDQAVANGQLIDSMNDGCFAINQRFRFQSSDDLDSNLFTSKAYLLLKDGSRKILLSESDTPFYLIPANEYWLSTNRISSLLDMGSMLRNGNLDKLSARVTQINQSDPKQQYLKDSESILRARLVDSPNNLDYLYSLALSQVLQYKAKDASYTLALIKTLDPTNIYSYLASSIVQLYRFKPRLALDNLSNIKQLTEDKSILEIVYTLEKISSIMLFDII